MDTFGKLIVRMYISYAQDEHGRTLSGSWRTLMSRWVEREDVDQIVHQLREANPDLRHLRVTFETREDINA